MTVWIENKLCDLCKKCLNYCPYKAIELSSETLSITNRCTDCCSCLEICKKKAIITNVMPKIIPNFNEHKNIWIFIEQCSTGIKKISLETIYKAQELGITLKEKTIAIMLGYNLSSFVEILNTTGIDEIIITDNKKLKDYDSQIYASVIKDIIIKHRPNILLFGSTNLSRDLAPRIAGSIKSGLTADCTELSIDPEENILLQTRPAFGGNIIATIATRFSRPQMATVRITTSKTKKNYYQQTKKNTIINTFKPIFGKIQNTKILNSITEHTKLSTLQEAKIIVAGGRGMKNLNGFNLIHQLASTLNAEIAGTRVAVENKWISEQKQIGQTGQIVAPDLYIACGISGAIQHRAGIMNSKFIVAINKDPEAFMFKISNWCIIGDVFAIIPKLIEQLKKYI